MKQVLQNIKLARTKARKDRDQFKTSLLTTLLGDIEKIGKAFNRVTTDDESIKVVKKFIKNDNDMIELLGDDTDKINLLMLEIEILSEFVPDQLSEEDLTNQIKIIIESLQEPKIGSVMKQLKETLDEYDGKLASSIIRGLL